MEIPKLQKCGDCGNMFPVNKNICLCGWKPKAKTIFESPNRIMPKVLITRLSDLGLNRKQGENAKQQALRCKTYLREAGLMKTLPQHLQEKL